jgi:hypothetical protein
MHPNWLSSAIIRAPATWISQHSEPIPRGMAQGKYHTNSLSNHPHLSAGKLDILPVLRIPPAMFPIYQPRDLAIPDQYIPGRQIAVRKDNAMIRPHLQRKRLAHRPRSRSEMYRVSSGCFPRERGTGFIVVLMVHSALGI